MNAVALGWTLAEIAGAVDGEAVGHEGDVVQSVTTDSRDIEPGCLFVALRGEFFDGHAFADAALADGAAAVLVERDASINASPRIEVDSTLDALAALAIKRRDEIDVPVVAVTGSTGKTSTKDLLASGLVNAWASPRSFNNEVGVPLTVLGTPSDASVVILEVGSRGKGHIDWLAPIVRPDVAVITNLGVVHLETFGTREGLADAKYELVEALGADGVAVLPFGESLLERDSDRQTITFGGEGADIVVSDVSVDGLGLPHFRLTSDRVDQQVTLPLAGEHNAQNAAAGVAVVSSLGLDVGAFLGRLSGAVGSDWRMDVHAGQFTVVNDAYNANPQSVESALRTVAAMDGRHVAVLGVMAELGHVCEEEHLRIGQLARDLNFAEILVVGSDHGYARGFGSGARKATDIGEAADTLADVVEPGDVVLVKASRSAGLERLALLLIEESAP